MNHIKPDYNIVNSKGTYLACLLTEILKLYEPWSSTIITYELTASFYRLALFDKHNL